MAGYRVALAKRGIWLAEMKYRVGDPETPKDFHEYFVEDGWRCGARFSWHMTEGFQTALMEATTSWPRQLEPGTYELVGPSIFGNPLKLTSHTLRPHVCCDVDHDLGEHEAEFG